MRPLLRAGVGRGAVARLQRARTAKCYWFALIRSQRASARIDFEVNDEVYESGRDDKFGLSRAAEFAKNPFCTRNFSIDTKLASRALSLRAKRNFAVAKLLVLHLLRGPAAEEAREAARALAGVVLRKLGHRLLPIYLPALRQDLLDARHALAHGRLALRIL